MKKLFGIILGICLAIVILTGIITFKAGAIIHHAMEEFGPSLTGTPVTLSDVDISLLSGKAQIKNLVIGNPKGFKSNSAVKVNNVAVSLDVQSLFSEKISIQKINVDGAELSYEVGKGGSNIRVLQRNIERHTTTALKSEGASKVEKSEPDTNLIIDEVFINGTKVNLVATVLGGKGASVLLPDIHLRDIGKKDGGASPAFVAKLIFGAITKNIGRSVTQILLTDQIKIKLDKEVSDNFKGVGSKLKGLIGGEK
jgi:uncharacterized protein involved in outer membrane biogenesis